MSNSLNRRTMLSVTATALAACTASVPAVALATASQHPDAALLDLCERWHATHAEYVAVVLEASEEVDALPRPQCPPELFMSLTGETRAKGEGPWQAIELDGMVRNGKYPETTFKDIRSGGVMTWFDQALTPEELDTALKLLRQARAYERSLKDYRAEARVIESRSREPMERLDALFREMSDTVATTTEGFNAKRAIIVKEASDFSDDFIQEAALNLLRNDVPAVLAGLNGGVVS